MGLVHQGMMCIKGMSQEYFSISLLGETKTAWGVVRIGRQSWTLKSKQMNLLRNKCWTLCRMLSMREIQVRAILAMFNLFVKILISNDSQCNAGYYQENINFQWWSILLTARKSQRYVSILSARMYPLQPW